MLIVYMLLNHYRRRMMRNQYVCTKCLYELNCSWKTVEISIECIKYYSIYLYLILDFIVLYTGIPNLLSFIHLLMICILIVKQILYKESKNQWYVCGFLFLVMFFVKYISLLPIVNKLLFIFVEEYPWVHDSWVHPYEIGLIPHSNCCEKG